MFTIKKNVPILMCYALYEDNAGDEFEWSFS